MPVKTNIITVKKKMVSNDGNDELRQKAKRWDVVKEQYRQNADGTRSSHKMAFADTDPDGNALIITFVGEDEDGNPCTFKIKIEDFFDSSFGSDPSKAVVTLNISGSEISDIIDFSKIYGLENQNINISEAIISGGYNPVTRFQPFQYFVGLRVFAAKFYKTLLGNGAGFVQGIYPGAAGFLEKAA